MQQLFESDLALLTLTVALYCLGGALYRRTRLMILHPVLLTFVAVILFLRAAGIDYARYSEATGILRFALGMSVVALGYLLYEQVERLRGSLLPVAVSTLVGCLVGIGSVVLIAGAMGADRQLITSLAPKSVTIPIAVAVVEPLGAIVPVTSVVVFWALFYRSSTPVSASSATSAASRSCAARASPIPRRGASRWAPRPTASARRAPSSWGPSRGR